MKPLLLFSLLLLIPQNSQAWQKTFINSLKNGGACVENSQGTMVFEHRSEDFFTPASIMKVATAALALDVLGSDYRFKTEFYVTMDNDLIMKGYGDPYLVSENLLVIAQNLKEKGIRTINRVIVDNSFFEPNILLDGTAETTDPYSALNGAVVANFNTVFVKKTPQGLVSAERQTPTVPLIQTVRNRLKLNTERVNLGTDTEISALYAGQLLIAFLKQVHVQVEDKVEIGVLEKSAKKVYTYTSSKRLDDVMSPMLEFSTNFIANQLFLVSGAQKFGAPATEAKSIKALREFLTQKVGWEKAQVFEGAGLSYKNKVSCHQMLTLLKYFEPHQNLLPLKEGVFHAKTGTLRVANTLAGYFKSKGQEYRFAILVNSQVPHNYKFQVAKMLYQGINSQ